MNQAKFVSSFSLTLLVVAATTMAQKPAVPEPTDYAWGFAIHTEEESSFYSVELPLEVNQSVTDPELRDAGVYNADGNPVGRVFEPVSDDVEQVEHLRQLPLVPLYSTTERSSDDIKLLFERDGDKTRLELNSDQLPAPGKDAQLTAYIVDTRQLPEAIEALQFDWAPVSSGFIGTITIDGSGNLENWTAIGSGAVADLRQDATSIVQRRVTVKKSNHDFLRIRWHNMPDEWRLIGIRGEYGLGITKVIRKTIMLSSSELDSEDGGRIFSLGGAPKVDRLRVVLSEPNTVISAVIYYWSETQDRWVQCATGSFHFIGRGNNSVRNGATRIAKVRSSRFKIVVSQGQPQLPLQLEIGWRPDSLLFLAQGRSPFTLVTGRARDADEGFPQQTMFGDRSIANLATADGRASTARLGPRYSLGGAQRLLKPSTPKWRKIALWLGLTLGVAFVGLMASKVVRELKSA